MLTILSCIIVRSLNQLRGTANQQDKVEPDNAQLGNVE